MLGMRSDKYKQVFFSLHGLKGKFHVKPAKILFTYVLIDLLN